MNAHAPLSFSDYLIQLPLNLVFDRFLKASLQPRRILSASMVKDIAVHFSSEKNLAAVFSSLSEEARFNCSLAYLFGRPGLPLRYAGYCGLPGIPDESSRPVKGRKKGPAAGQKVFGGFDDELLRSFLVYAAADEAGELRYLGFDEFEPELRPLCAGAIAGKTRVKPEKAAHYSSPGFCLNDVAALVCLASQGKLKITKTGNLSKASELSMEKVLHAAHSPYNSIVGDCTPTALCLLYARDRGLVYLDRDAYREFPAQVRLWLAEPLSARHADFIDFAFASFTLWKKSMLEELLPKAGDPWISASAFGERLKPVVTSIAMVLAYCGLVDFYKSGANFIFTRSRLGRPGPAAALKEPFANRTIISPDFSALLPQETTPGHIYKFSKVGSLLSLDRIYKGMITEEIINTSLSEGISGAVLLEWLTQWHCPSNVLETVREWIREFSRLSLESGSIIVTMEDNVGKQLLSYEPLRKIIEPIKASGIFRVVRGQEENARSLLLAMGFDPRSPSPTPPPTAAAPLHGQEERGLGQPEAPRRGRVTPVVNFSLPVQRLDVNVKQGKYSAEMKPLEVNDTAHVIEYALLMGCSLKFDYAGSPNIRKGIYRVRPLSFKRGAQPMFHGETPSKSRKLFLLEKIQKIGVELHHDKNE